MARPVQLRYNDAQDGETVIGTYLTDDNLINDGMLKNSGSGEYTRLEITGDIQLQENLPIDYTSFGDAKNGESEPEILVYTYEASSGNFILRDRVFPEDAGIIKDKGTYRNDNLWGFQKWVGRQRVTGVSLSNATITEIVDALLPSGYTAVTPAGDSVPTVTNYSYTGNINGALRDIIRDYPVKIWFTANLDGNNDYEVKVESKGFGGVIQTVTFDDERQTEGYSINSFQPEDKSNIVNKVEIIGKASDGTKIQEIVDDQTSISNHGERYIKRNVGYVEDSSQATSLANSILSPDPSPHAEMSIPFQEDNQLNGSVDILDNRYGIDAVYTIVKQRDFFTEGRTEVELGFEKNRTEKRRDTTRDLDERNNQLFPTSQTDVGNQSVDADTETVTDEYDNHSPSAVDHDVNGQSFTENTDSFEDAHFNQAVPAAGNDSTTVSIGELLPEQDFVLFIAWININEGERTTSTNGKDFDVVARANSGTSITVLSETGILGETNFYQDTSLVPQSVAGVDDGDIEMSVTDNDGLSYSYGLSVNGVSQMTINQPAQTNGTSSDADGSTNSVNTNDQTAGDTSSLNATGSTENNVNVNTTSEDKTDR